MMQWRKWCVTGVLALGVVAVLWMEPLQARSGFSQRSVKGTYGIFFAGQSVPSLQPESGTGVITADGKGNLTGVETYNLGTQVCENIVLKGTYTVDATTGTGKLTAESEGVSGPCSFSFNASFVILKGGALLRLASTDPGFVIISEEWRRRSGD
ncbi:MAG TPA: hypothetical protein VKJ47_05815 [Candidatus Binatia bacterium]|nr:hypothetical protein [Candidatus Binatia bacterium]